MESIPSQLHPRKAHPIFENHDILLIIFSFLDPETFFNGNIWDMEENTRSNLRSASLTCTAFFGPASGLLWRMLDSVVPVLKLLPTFVPVNDIYTINDTIISKHQERMDLYAHKVRYLYLAHLHESVRGHVLHRLSSTKTPLFPNLQSVYIPSLEYAHNRSNVETTNIVFLAFSESLTTLAIGGISSEANDDAASYLSVLNQRNVPLNALDLEGRLTRHVLTMINHFTQLKYLHLSLKGATLFSGVFQSWTLLPSLTNLYIHFDSTSSFSIQNDQITSLGIPDKQIAQFKALEEFHFRGLPTEALKILKNIENLNTLRCIVLLATPLPLLPQNEADYVNELMKCMQECTRIAWDLESIKIQMEESGRDIALPERALHLLSACRHLQVIEFSGLCIALDDIMVKGLCANENWRNMRVLCLPLALGKCPSFLSLITIANNCPNLEYLKISVDLQLSTSETLDNQRLEPRMLHKLQNLTVVKFPPPNRMFRHPTDDTNTMKMAVAISRLIEYHFPDIKDIDLIPNIGTDLEWWRGVLSLIREFQTIRVETRCE